MNKYKFADKVLHAEKGLGSVLGWYERMDSQIAYHVAWASLSGGVENRTFLESELMPIVESHWIKSTDKMPDCDELRSKPYKAIFWIAVQRDKQPPFITLGVRRYRHGVWQWAQGHMERDSQLIFADDTVTHYIHVEAPEAPK